MSKNLILLLLALLSMLLPGCRDRDGWVDAGPVVVDQSLLPPGLRPDPRPEVR